MKNFFLTAVIAVCTLFFGIQNIQAQGQQGQLRIGPGLMYGSEIESIGIQLRGDYAITDHILFAPDFIYFFPDTDFGIDFNWFEINLNANYLFEVSNPDVIPYALAGFNIAIISFDLNNVIIPGVRDDTNTELGFNLGGGANFLVGSLTIIGEIRYAIGNDQLVIGGAVVFPI